MLSWTVNFRQETVGPLVINVVDSGREAKGGEGLVSIDQGPLNKHTGIIECLFVRKAIQFNI